MVRKTRSWATQSERGGDDQRGEFIHSFIESAIRGAARRVYQAALVDLGPLQSDGDAVGEDEGQNHVVEQLVGDDGLTQLSEPARRPRAAFSLVSYVTIKFSNPNHRGRHKIN